MKITIEFSWKSNRGSDTTRNLGDQSVQRRISWSLLLQHIMTDTVKSFIINNKSLVCIFQKLVSGKNSVIRFDNGVGNLWRRINTVSGGDSIWISISNLQQQ